MSIFTSESTFPAGYIPKNRISDYVCLNCAGRRLVKAEDPEGREFNVCPNCGKTYYPKMHTMRRDPKTQFLSSLKNASNAQNNLLTKKSKSKYSVKDTSPKQFVSHENLGIRYIKKGTNCYGNDSPSPLIRSITNTTSNKQSIRVTKYMRKEGTYFKQQQARKLFPELLNSGVEITSFEEG